MSRRPAPSSSSALPPQNRQNEYFVPRDGIDREVITADICRYLGNDALVRPGTYESPNGGPVIQGYYINAYRNLTTAMIEDLKADSARWDQERRQQSANSRNNAAGVQYRNSDTHQSRQYYGPTESGFASADLSRGDMYGDSTPRYPGTGSAGYTGAAGAYAGQQYPQGGYSTQQGYTTQASQFQSPPANVNYSMPAPGFSQGGQDPPYTLVGADSRVANQQYSDPYQGSRDPRDPRDQRGAPMTTMPASRTTYATSGAPVPQGYPSTAGGGGFYPPNPSPSNPPYVPTAQPGDPFYGRASPAGTTSYGTAQDQQYDATPAPTRSSTSTTSAQLQSSGTSSRHRERESVDRTESRHAHRHRSGR